MAVDIDIYTLDLDESALDLVNLLDGVLSRVVALFESYGVPVPRRRYWTMTTPAIDCEQLVVSFTQMYLGPPGDEASTPQRCNQPRTAVMEIMVTRAIPVVGQNGQVPSADKIEKASRISAVDAWVLMHSLNLLDQWDDAGLYGPGVIATVSSGEVSGGFQSILMQITMAVP